MLLTKNGPRDMVNVSNSRECITMKYESMQQALEALKKLGKSVFGNALILSSAAAERAAAERAAAECAAAERESARLELSSAEMAAVEWLNKQEAKQ